MTAPVALFGAAHLDLIAVPDRPAAPGDDLPGQVRARPGGVAANLALALAAHGRPVRLAAPIGDDPDGQALANHMESHGILLTRLGNSPTGRYLAIEDGAGGLLAAVADLAAAEAVSPADLAPHLDDLAEAPLVLLDANLPAPVLVAIAGAARPETPLAAIPASPAKAPRLTPILPRLAYLIANQAEANALTQNAFPDASSTAAALLALGVREAVVTDGPAAAAVAHAEGEHALSPPLDIGARATGAGDALAAAYLHRRLRGDPPERALAAGLAAAAVHRSGP